MTDDGRIPLKSLLTRHKAPPVVDRRVRQMIAREAARPRFGVRVRGWLAAARQAAMSTWPLAASFAAGVLVAVAVQATLGARDAGGTFEQDLVASHVRSLMPGHLTDVASSDRHAVKPWFAGKVDFAPVVVDLAARGFPLVGGRLDYVQERTVAALVYQRRAHMINLYVAPARGTPVPWKFATRQGYNVVAWQAGGMQFWAVSDLAQEELKQFAMLVRLPD